MAGYCSSDESSVEDSDFVVQPFMYEPRRPAGRENTEDTSPESDDSGADNDPDSPEDYDEVDTNW